MDGYVLVVDDDPNIRSLICDSLKLIGLQSRQAANGLEALKIIKDDHPLAVVMDLMMPGMNGFSTLTRIFRNKETRNIPVFILSGVADNSRQILRFPGVKGVMQKGNFSIQGFHNMLSAAGLKAA